MVPAKIPNTRRSYTTDEISKDCIQSGMTYFADQERCVAIFPSTDREAVKGIKRYITLTREQYLKTPGYDDSVKSTVVRA
jgi:hypothetical protein